MSEVLKMYEQFVTEENLLCRRVETLDIIQSYILHTVFTSMALNWTH
ncbi:hypothetical protein [Paenibacillus lutrae]|nr:hypothetical protein [Paenibacillus lutrae]